mmetsp:Transcript_70520/g.222779  ORF Transcript_70520/g.222779 Transcript_70520/m.222779 type:complete len:249 (-) Transcript_70520:231-977(-)
MKLIARSFTSLSFGIMSRRRWARVPALMHASSEPPSRFSSCFSAMRLSPSRTSLSRKARNSKIRSSCSFLSSLAKSARKRSTILLSFAFSRATVRMTAMSDVLTSKYSRKLSAVTSSERGSLVSVRILSSTSAPVMSLWLNMTPMPPPSFLVIRPSSSLSVHSFSMSVLVTQTASCRAIVSDDRNCSKRWRICSTTFAARKCASTHTRSRFRGQKLKAWATQRFAVTASSVVLMPGVSMIRSLPFRLS